MESYMKFITMLLMPSNYKIQQSKIINSTTDVCFSVFTGVIQSFKFKLCL